MTDPRYRPKNSGRSKSIYQEDDEFEEEEAKYDYEVDEDDEDEDEAEAEENRYSYRRRVIEEEANDEEEDDDDDDELERHPKKRKLKNLMDYELAPRSKNSQAGGSGGGGGGGGGARNSSPNEWTERETFALLEAWGNRYLELGRKSLRSEDWNEVAEKVSEVSKAERLDTQCRNRLDTLKKKYKKEKAILKEMGAGGGGSRWTYFKKMDMLMAVSTKQQCGLACGVDSGEYVFMNPKVYLNCANGFDEMRDSPGNSESCEGNDYDDGGGGDEGSSSFSLLADSIQKFGSIYEKIENSKRQQMMELEKMRLDFHKELELQKQQILERAQAEIEKIQDGDDIDDDDDDSDASAENLSG